MIRDTRRQREGWDRAFRMMAERDDDQLLEKDNLINQSNRDDEERKW